MRRLRAAVLAVPLVLLTSGCAGKGDLREMEQTLVAEFRELNAGQDSIRGELRALRRQLVEGLESREGEALAGRGELLNRLAQLEEQVGRVAALAGQNQQVLTRVERSLRDRRSPRGAGAEPGPAAPDTGAAEAGGRERQAPEAAAADARSLYEASLQQFRRGSYETARSGLEQFLERFPDHELAPDAQFYVAESYAEAGEALPALEAYGRVVELFPDSRRAASALYKSGVLEVDRGNVGDARVFFRRVVNGYPDSDEAALARDRLERLEEGGG